MDPRGRSKCCCVQPGSGQALCVCRRGHRRGPSRRGGMAPRAQLTVPPGPGQASGAWSPALIWAVQLVVIHISVSNPF